MILSLKEAAEAFNLIPKDLRQIVYKEIFVMIKGPCTHNSGPHPRQICQNCCAARDEALREIMSRDQ